MKEITNQKNKKTGQFALSCICTANAGISD
jgi:hypothetical protein